MIARFFARVWSYMKVAKFAFLGWLTSFILSVSLPGVEVGPSWWWKQAGVLLFITVLVVSIQWVMESLYGPKK